MRHVLLLAAGVFASIGCGGAPAVPDAVAQAAPNVLTEEERAAGFRLLFDGQTTAGWRGFGQDTMPDGWQVVDGALTRVGPGRDIVTTDTFANFELRLEWKVSPGGNSGILFRVSEDAEQTYHTGPEMQVLDDAGHRDGQSRLTAAGSNYGLHPSPPGVVRPAESWNSVRLVVNGASVKHWLNDSLVVSYELWSPEWEELVRTTKFAEWPGYGRGTSGHIALQDHGDRVAFRSIRLLVLP